MNLNLPISELDRLSWLRERYEYLLDKCWGKEFAKHYPDWHKELVSVDRERTGIVLNQASNLLTTKQ